jgi:hypothetical protein
MRTEPWFCASAASPRGQGASRASFPGSLAMRAAGGAGAQRPHSGPSPADLEQAQTARGGGARADGGYRPRYGRSSSRRFTAMIRGDRCGRRTGSCRAGLLAIIRWPRPGVAVGLRRRSVKSPFAGPMAIRRRTRSSATARRLQFRAMAAIRLGRWRRLSRLRPIPGRRNCPTGLGRAGRRHWWRTGISLGRRLNRRRRRRRGESRSESWSESWSWSRGLLLGPGCGDRLEEGTVDPSDDFRFELGVGTIGTRPAADEHRLALRRRQVAHSAWR